MNEQNEITMRLTVSSYRPYAAVLQEAIGMGSRFLASEMGIVRVEIYDENIPLRTTPIAVVTRDDVVLEEHKATTEGHFSAFLRVLQRLFRRNKVRRKPSENASGFITTSR